MKRLLFLAFLLITTASWSSPADSLLTALKTAQGESKVKILNELFRAYINSEPVTAIGYAREALTLATSIDDKKGMAAAYNNLGVSYRNQGVLDLALEYYSRSLDLYLSINNGEGIAVAKNNIANIYSAKKDYAQALKYYEESHSGFIALGKTDLIIGSMNNLGNLHSDLQLYDKALNYYSEAWKLEEKDGKPLADPLTNIGNLFYRQGNYQRAVEYYLRALAIVKSQNDKIGEVSLLANLGETYMMANQNAKAQQYLDDALTLATELQASFYAPQILKSSAANYAHQGKMKEAFMMMMQYDAAREKVYGEESTRKIAQQKVAMELRAKEREIEDLQKEDRIKTLQLRNIQFVVTAIVMGVITFLSVIYLVFLRKQIRRIK